MVKLLKSNKENSDVQDDITPSVPQKEDILSERAAILSLESINTIPEIQTLSILEFKLDNDIYGINILEINKVYPFTDITVLPGTPSFLAGIISTHGQINAVINLKKFMKVTSENPSKYKYIIFLKKEHIALTVDEICGVSRVLLSEIQLLSHSYDQYRFLKGITSQQTIIIDIPQLVVDSHLIIDESV